MSKSSKIESRGGVIIMIIVALLAVMEVVNSKLEEKIASSNYKYVSYSNWYNAKSIKQILKENQRDYLESLRSAGLVEDEKMDQLDFRIEMTDDLIRKYEEEKTEILLGSDNIPRSAWSQDLDGEMGKIVGLRAWEEVGISNRKLVAQIDIGILFLQISILFGVLGMIIHDNRRLQEVFTGLMIASGFIGLAVSLYGYYSVL
ncbi:protein of unknown function [Zobellia uliginosa]|uniref:DUF4337 domain-containing protein n=1 Tax=Zobellia uliginosa TaxID=143224 RepID=A0ABY1L3H5_9FLAO|nr:DUF4337 family protein [Zobellia uliginosa]MDO6518872.1 DUF4337 family protein [Zobellia uliginosa]SIS99269.1 protein of unknown function [Zobellia uliginosa]